MLFERFRNKVRINVAKSSRFDVFLALFGSVCYDNRRKNCRCFCDNEVLFLVLENRIAEKIQ